MKKLFVLVLLAAFVAVGTSFAVPSATITFDSGFRAVPPKTSTGKTDLTGTGFLAFTWNQDASANGMMADLSVGWGLKDSGLSFLWAYPTVGYQWVMGNAVLAAFGKMSTADPDFRAGVSVFGQIPIGKSSAVVLGTSGEVLLPFVKKSFTTEGDDNFFGVSAKPRLSYVFGGDKEIGLIGWLSWDNKLINSKTWMSEYLKVFFRWDMFSVSAGVEANPSNMKDGKPMAFFDFDTAVNIKL